jgi:Lar family restriction alleviation protein
MKNEKLKPCPFCGSDRIPTIFHRDMKPIENPEADYRLRHYFLCCSGCTAQGAILPNKQHAIDAWNTRKEIT